MAIKPGYAEPLTPHSLNTPVERANNFWYDVNTSDTVIVFVHGIFSDSRGCWLFEDLVSGQRVFWPDLIRGDDRLGRPSIFLGGFHTSIDAGDFSVAQCARELLEALERRETDGTRPALDREHIVFVGHSTGGIVVRYMLERYQERFRHKAVGLSLIASPSLGSVWANVASLAARFYNQRLGLQLRWDGEALEDIHGRFRDLVDDRSLPRLFGMEACENKMILRDRVPGIVRWMLPTRLKVVNSRSAGQYFGEVKVLRDTDHFTSVKPTGLDHPSHEFLVTFMSRFRAAMSALAPLIIFQAVERFCGCRISPEEFFHGFIRQFRLPKKYQQEKGFEELFRDEFWRVIRHHGDSESFIAALSNLVTPNEAKGLAIKASQYLRNQFLPNL